MSILGKLVKKGLEIRNKAAHLGPHKTPFQNQRLMLRRLLSKAESTSFGKTYGFEKLLDNFSSSKPTHQFYEDFKKAVPVHTYNQMYKNWWNRCLAGEADVCWPGQVKFFALSSGTSEASTKRIPVTKSMIRALQKTGVRQIFSLAEYDLDEELFTKGILMLGGSTDLHRQGHYYEGDMSGIQTSMLPVWFQQFYKPGKRIAMLPDWNRKLDEICEKAKDWDIAVIAGVPAWVQILIEKIIVKYKLKNIHELWPNLSIYVHGGVSFEPYKKSFDGLMGKPMLYLETYLASEGFIAYEYRSGYDMKLVLDNGLFLEFVPFNEENFDSEGEIIANPQAFMIDQVEEGKDYALLLSTCAGAWRYLIGDTVKVTNKERGEIIITGRTKHFLSLCGEHLSVENMTHAVALTGEEFNLPLFEFTVSGRSIGSGFEHHWYLAVDEKGTNAENILEALDKHLKVLNDDYRVERSGPLTDLKITLLPSSVFYGFMKKIGKEGGQNKFPRVLKKKQLEEWEGYIASVSGA